jgi:hypothetical protein
VAGGIAPPSGDAGPAMSTEVAEASARILQRGETARAGLPPTKLPPPRVLQAELEWVLSLIPTPGLLSAELPPAEPAVSGSAMAGKPEGATEASELEPTAVAAQVPTGAAPETSPVVGSGLPAEIEPPVEVGTSNPERPAVPMATPPETPRQLPDPLERLAPPSSNLPEPQASRPLRRPPSPPVPPFSPSLPSAPAVRTAVRSAVPDRTDARPVPPAGPTEVRPPLPSLPFDAPLASVPAPEGAPPEMGTGAPAETSAAATARRRKKPASTTRKKTAPTVLQAPTVPVPSPPPMPAPGPVVTIEPSTAPALSAPAAAETPSDARTKKRAPRKRKAPTVVAASAGAIPPGVFGAPPEDASAPESDPHVEKGGT